MLFFLNKKSGKLLQGGESMRLSEYIKSNPNQWPRTICYAITPADCHSEGDLQSESSVLLRVELTSMCFGEISGSWSAGSGGPWTILSLW